MVVRTEISEFAGFVSHDLERAISDNLVGVHVGCGACSALDHVHREHVVPLTGKNLLASLFDGCELSVCEQAELMVSNGCTKLSIG